MTRAECSEAGILVEAEMSETELFGRNLAFRRRVFSAVGSDTLEICDTLENRGAREEEYCLLYHVNVGYPMLDEGAELVDDAEEVIPRTPWAAEHLAERRQMGASVDNEEEMCYFLRLKTPAVSLVNKALGKTFSLAWSGDTLPHFVEWKSMASGDYALGLEPCTTELDDRFVYKKIGAGERVAFRIKIGVRK